MTKYIRVRSTIESSDSSDYENAQKYEFSETITDDEVRIGDVFEVAITDTTYYLNHLSDVPSWGVEGIMIENLDSTNVLEVKWYVEKGRRPATNLAIVNTGGVYTLEDQNDDDWSADPTLAEVGDWVYLLSCEDSTNTGTVRLITAIADKDATKDNMTIIGSLTANADDDTAVACILAHNRIQLGAGEWVKIGGENIVAALNMNLKAYTAPVKCAVSYWGT